MSTQIIPTISFDTAGTSTGYKVPIVEQVQGNESRSPYGRSNPFYRVGLPTGINVSEIVEHKISQLRDTSVQNQVGELIQRIQDILERDFYFESNLLSRLHMTEEEDDCVSIEWNFKQVRIGFVIESDRAKSFFYIVSFCEDDDSYDSKSRRLWSHINQLPSLVNLATQNS